MIEKSVLGHLTLAVVVEKLDQKDVVITDKRHLGTIGRPYRSLLRTTIRQRLQLTGSHGVDIKYSFVGTTIDWLRLSADEHSLAIRRHDIAVEVVNLSTLCVIYIKQHRSLLTSLERILYHLLPILGNAGILISTL